MWNWTQQALKHYFIGHWRYLLRHWFLLILLGVVWAFIAGWIGAGFGVPLLFRDDPAFDYKFVGWSLNRPSIAGYTAATVLLAAVLTVIYVFEIAGTLPSRTRGQTVRETVRFFAIAGALPLLALVLAAAMPSFELADGAPACGENNTYCQASSDRAPSPEKTVPIEEAAPRFHLDEGIKAIIGILLGCGIAFFIGYVILELSGWIARAGPVLASRWPWLGRWFGWLRSFFSAKARQEYPLMVAAVLTVLLAVNALFVFAFIGVNLTAIARPGAAICIFFGMIVAFYFLIMLLAPSLRFVGVIAFLAVHAFYGADRYINELPGFKARYENEAEKIAGKIDYYDCLLPLDKNGDLDPDLPFERRDHLAAACDPDHVERASIVPNENDDQDTPALVSARQWVDLWDADDADNDEGSRNLVVIATQGGAYRASFWTSLILDELIKRSEDELPGLVDRVGLLTGASGGMVASAYFAVMSTEEGAWNESALSDDCGMNVQGEGAPTWAFGPVTSRLCLDILEANTSPADDAIADKSGGEDSGPKFPSPRPIARDSLTPVAAQTILFDIRRVLSWPFTGLPGLDRLGLNEFLDWNDQTYHDRGLILERQWKTLDTSYGDLAKAQEDFRATKGHPSMIISPMIADTGQPVLISNLDLECLENLDVHNVEPRGAREAVSMFHWFPDVRDDFKVGTAVRMNASFPYISPAVSLPTTVRRRVVDAGYYDNYGVNTAVSWLFQDDVVEALADPKSGIDGLVIIQIRAFPGRDQGRADDDRGDKAGKPALAHGKEPHKADMPLIPEWMTSPLAGVLSARSGSMAYRNDAQIERLKRVLAAKGRDENFVRSIVFENHADSDQVGVSWHITPRELARLEMELKSPWNLRQFETLKTYWNRSTPAVSDEPTAPDGPGDRIAKAFRVAERVEPAAGPASSCSDSSGQHIASK